MKAVITLLCCAVGFYGCQAAYKPIPDSDIDYRKLDRQHPVYKPLSTDWKNEPKSKPGDSDNKKEKDDLGPESIRLPSISKINYAQKTDNEKYLKDLEMADKLEEYMRHLPKDLKYIKLYPTIPSHLPPEDKNDKKFYKLDHPKEQYSLEDTKEHSKPMLDENELDVPSDGGNRHMTSKKKSKAGRDGKKRKQNSRTHKQDLHEHQRQPCDRKFRNCGNSRKYVCGDDGITYLNKCHLKRQSCRKGSLKAIKVLHRGKCKEK